MSKKLHLSRERLTELTNEELATVAAGFGLTGTETYECPGTPDIRELTKVTRLCNSGTNCYSWAC